MPDIEEAVRDALGAQARGAPSSETLWTDVQRRIRRRKRRRQSLIGAAAAFVLLAAGLGVALAARGDDDESTVVDVGPGPSTSVPAVATTTTVPDDATGAPGPQWLELAAGPIREREGTVAIWTGTQLVEWGGTYDQTYPVGRAQGAVYDPIGNSWYSIADSPLDLRADPVAVWTGQDVIVWGGVSSREPAGITYRNDGAAYDPVTDSWREIAPSPLPPDDYHGVWTGRELVVIGGGEAAVTGAAYDPVTNSWREITPPPMAIVSPRLAWSGEEVLVVGGVRTGENNVQQFSVWPWDPATDTWREQGGVPVNSQSVEAVWTNGQLVVLTHQPSQDGTQILDGAHGNYHYVTGFPAECEDQIQAVVVAGQVLSTFCRAFAWFATETGLWSSLPPPSSAVAGTLVAADATAYLLGEDGSLRAITL